MTTICDECVDGSVEKHTDYLLENFLIKDYDERLCESLNKEIRNSDITVKYDWFYSNDIHDIVKAEKIMQNGLKYFGNWPDLK